VGHEEEIENNRHSGNAERPVQVRTQAQQVEKVFIETQETEDEQHGNDDPPETAVPIDVFYQQIIEQNMFQQDLAGVVDRGL
jgi:hypothetical protein